MSKKKKGLGRGLGALLQDHRVDAPGKNTSNTEGELIHEILVEKIEPNPFQPRKTFSEEEIQELAETILKHGLIQPIVVRKHADTFQIVSGERRFRAYQKLKKTKIPARVHERLTDKNMMEIAIIENIQRVQLSPMEEAQSFEQLINHHAYRHEDLAEILGKSRSAISNTLRLLKLPTEVQNWITEGTLSAGHARNLLRPEIADPIEAARIIIEEGLSVRDAEKVHLRQNKSTKPSVPNQNLDPNVVQFENDLRYAMGADVKLQVNKNKGKIEIKFNNLEELNRIRDLIQAGSNQVN